jgi:hypothetical protein
MVRSGMAATKPRTCSAAASSGERFQPPYRSGATLPCRRQRCISLTTKLMLTSNLAALARHDARPLPRAPPARADSKEYGRVIHRWPPRPSDQFESQQPCVVIPIRFRLFRNRSSNALACGSG